MDKEHRPQISPARLGYEALAIGLARLRYRLHESCRTQGVRFGILEVRSNNVTNTCGRFPLTKSRVSRRPAQQVPPAFQGQGRIKPDIAPLIGGSLVFTISHETTPSASSSHSKRHVDRLLMQLETTSKGGPSVATGQKKPTDVVQEARLVVQWKPLHNALVPNLAREDMTLDVSVVSAFTVKQYAFAPFGNGQLIVSSLTGPVKA